MAVFKAPKWRMMAPRSPWSALPSRFGPSCAPRAYAVEQALDLAAVGPKDLLVRPGLRRRPGCALQAAQLGAEAIGWDLDDALLQEARCRALAQGLQETLPLRAPGRLRDPRGEVAAEGPPRWCRGLT